VNIETTNLNLEPGERLAGVYLLQRALETGGSPAIWLAEDEVLGKSVALHFLPPAVATDERALAEIRLEVKRTRPLIHPNILRVYDLVEGEGWAAVATEAFVGQRLSAALEERGRYEVQDVDGWLDQVCVALEEAHRIKLIHRDLAAENIFLKPDGRVLLANFGVGRAVQNSLLRSGGPKLSDARLSSTAPQLLESGSAAASDDVYGVGALFYHLITGEPAFQGGDVVEKIRDTVPARLSEVRFEADDRGVDIPPSWDNVIAACLNKSRDERPSSPAEIVSSIEAYAPPADAAAAPLAFAPSAESVETVVDREPEPEVPAPVFVPSVAETAIPLSLLRETVPAAEAPAPAPESPMEIELPVEPDAEPLAAASEAAENAQSEITPAVTETSKTEEKPQISAPEKAEPAVTRPLYDTDEDAFSNILPKRFRFPAAVAAAVAVVLFLINGAFKTEKEKTLPAGPVATSDPADGSELTAVKNAGRETPAQPVDEAPAPGEAPSPAATQKAPAQPEMLMAAGPTTKAPAASAIASASPADQQIEEKTAALNKMKADLAAVEEQERAKLREKQAAEAAAAEAQKAIDAKTQATTAAKKETQELLAARKQREDEQKSADLAAQAAQQLAAEKLRVAEDAKKAFADFETKNRSKLAAQDKIDAELQTLQRTLEDQRKVADESARAAAAASTARQQQRAAIEQTEQDLANARALAAKSSEENQRKMAVDSERKRLDDEIAAMRTLFEQKMKDIEDRRRQLEGGAAVPMPATAPASKAAAASIPEPPRPIVTPAAGLALMPAKSEPPLAFLTTPAPVAPSSAAVPGASTNSLGQRFVPVGEVYFGAWLTRWKDFDAFARAVNLKSTAWRGPGFRQGPDHPVVNVTWNEAIAFCKWLTDKEHKEGALPANQFYRLPYDLEWSKAVGLPTETGKTPEDRDMGVPDVYPWGTDWPPPKGAGNYTGEETGSDVAIKGYDDGFAWTSPVGSFPANQMGIYDMGGNVWQWCMDTWNADSKARALRGASWYNGALKLSLLASCRVKATPDSSTDNYGFRIVRATEAGGAKPGRR